MFAPKKGLPEIWHSSPSFQLRCLLYGRLPWFGKGTFCLCAKPAKRLANLLCTVYPIVRGHWDLVNYPLSNQMSVSTGLDFVWYIYSIGKYLNLQRRTCAHGYHGARARGAHLRQRVRLVSLHFLSLIVFVTRLFWACPWCTGWLVSLFLVAAISIENL